MAIGRLSNTVGNQAPTPVPFTDAEGRYNPGQTASPVNPPSTSYAETRSALKSVDAVPASYLGAQTGIVRRAFRLNGIDDHYVRGGETMRPGVLQWVPESSKAQQVLVRMWPWSINRKWYIAYPAASVMLGGMHNLGLAEKSPQLATRTTGGPGPGRMGVRPRYVKVQNVPAFNTAPKTYGTQKGGIN